MRRVILSLAALFLVVMPLRAQSAASDSIAALDRAWAQMYQVHDTATALKLYSPDVLITSAQGGLKTRAAELGDVRPSPGLKMSYFRTTDVQIKVHGSTAVVSGIAEWAFSMNGGTESALRRRYTATYARGGPMGWTLVALHMGNAPRALG